ncbi:hypothetical protein EXIGLDRAFT_844700 [Exidia glandulosa HHB12029]|uniref:Uncharacterized protein n=1 Tax=Exidia glandulosa HHB12029 TaxID=1314781 RepID=A0A165BW50_EXIGL|nr:hypothetical protein EXIGLDRAFT_844700 [Exidia glandulosa HHB12029]
MRRTRNRWTWTTLTLHLPESESESEDEEDEEDVDGDEDTIALNARVGSTHALPCTQEANAIHIKQIIIDLKDYQTLFPEAIPITESWLRSAVAARLHGYEFDANRPLTYGDLIDAGLICEIHYVFKDRASSMTDEDWKTPLDRDALFDMRIPDNDAQFFWCPKD